ncbi:MAG: hypothetical protein ALECFALPRED_000654 [Alectoria fallacina]|uniref:Uncharacterized protein n=1 Tax=Alectoria fallacina TaxID=1903189 RepID=A0A8H3JAE4_9LECA|nr:MAG: hypothetical protein ALECFALPRED_000654 [Alectoria fallacina]
MATTYEAAKAVGITSIDAYMFPCTGTQPTGVACKSISTQISEFLDAIDSDSIPANHLWLDIEPEDASQSGVACNAWQLGSAGNEALAEQWVAAIKATGRNWGIYANYGQWPSMFASINTDIGSDLPLWAVQDDFEPGVSTVDKFFGGWTTAYAKQYHLATGTDLPLCSASVDLDSFTA